MKYIILSSWTTRGLVELVNQYISERWEPQGGVVVGWTTTFESHGKGTEYCQAMVKKYEITLIE